MADEKKSKWMAAKDVVVTICAIVGAFGTGWMIYDHVAADSESASAECTAILGEDYFAELAVDVVNRGRRPFFVKNVYVEWPAPKGELRWLPYHGGIPREVTAVEPGASKRFDLVGIGRGDSVAIKKAGSKILLVVESPKGELIRRQTKIDTEHLDLVLLGQDGCQRLLAQGNAEMAGKK